MNLAPGGAFSFQGFINASSGALSAADALPTAKLYRNGAYDAAVTVTVTSLSTGEYLAAGTIPSTYAAGDVCQVVLAATIGGIATASTVGEFVVSSKADATAALAAVGLSAATPYTSPSSGEAATVAGLIGGSQTSITTNFPNGTGLPYMAYHNGVGYPVYAGTSSVPAPIAAALIAAGLAH